MSSPSIDPVSTSSVNQTPVVSTDTNTQITGASSSSSGSTGSASSRVSSLEDLKKKSPQVYNAMLQGIAMNICNKMKDSQDRIHQINQEAQQNA